jgi:hypothetical protein
MTDKCTKPELGAMLHAYEMGGLSEDDAERFELHLISCDYCLAEIRNFSHYIDVMRSSEAARAAVANSAEDTAQPRMSRLRRWLWPRDIPHIFRPGIFVIVILLLVYPGFVGFEEMFEKSPRYIQAAALSSARSMGQQPQTFSGSKDAVITFMFSGAVEGKPYTLTILSESGKTVYTDPAFADFDEFETSRLLIDAGTFAPGTYRMQIVDPTDESGNGKQQYYFQVDE